jgi:hypothetical protein
MPPLVPSGLSTALPELDALRDPAFQAATRLTRLRQDLLRAHEFLIACHRDPLSAAPPVFFFHAPRPAGQPNTQLPAPVLRPEVVARNAVRHPELYLAWCALPEHYAGLIDQLTASRLVRRIARATPGVREANAKFVALVPEARLFEQLLAVADDWLIRAIHPQRRVGVRLLVHGLTDANHLNVLLADELCGAPNPFRLGGRRPSPRVRTAYSNGFALLNQPIAEGQFQLFRTAALQPNGELPQGLCGCQDWLPGEQFVSELPLIRGECPIWLGDPAYPTTWEATPRIPHLTTTVEKVEVLTRWEVDQILEAACPGLQPSQPRLAAA